MLYEIGYLRGCLPWSFSVIEHHRKYGGQFALDRRLFCPDQILVQQAQIGQDADREAGPAPLGLWLIMYEKGGGPGKGGPVLF